MPYRYLIFRRLITEDHSVDMCEIIYRVRLVSHVLIENSVFICPCL